MANAFGTDRDLNKDASPLYHVRKAKKSKLELPDFFVAKRGSKERIRKIGAFVHELRATSVRVVEFAGDGYSHSGINKSIGKQGDQGITPALVEFLTDVL